MALNISPVHRNLHTRVSFLYLEFEDWFVVMGLVHSDAMFVMAVPRECTEAFLEAHVLAFQFFGFVLRRISYDNPKVAVTQIPGAHRRKLTAAFGRLVGHYLFQPYFCRIRRANEKGVVEGAVRYSRCILPVS